MNVFFINARTNRVITVATYVGDIDFEEGSFVLLGGNEWEVTSIYECEDECEQFLNVFVA